MVHGDMRRLLILMCLCGFTVLHVMGVGSTERVTNPQRDIYGAVVTDNGAHLPVTKPNYACVTGVNDHCLICASYTTCSKCFENYFLFEGACYFCGNNCITCASATTCALCRPGYMAVGGICVGTSVGVVWDACRVWMATYHV
jgi:hypothetical protein